MSRSCISCSNFAGRRRPIWCQFKGQFPVLPPIPLSHGCEILRRMVPPSRQTVIGLDIGTREYIETTKVLTAPRPRPAWASPVYRIIKFELLQNESSESELERIITHVISNLHAWAERGALARECSSSSSSSSSVRAFAPNSEDAKPDRKQCRQKCAICEVATITKTLT